MPVVRGAHLGSQLARIDAVVETGFCRRLDRLSQGFPYHALGQLVDALVRVSDLPFENGQSGIVVCPDGL